MNIPRLVVIETPFAANDVYTVEQHKLYLDHCIQDSLRRGEAPFASHGFYTHYLDDDNRRERAIGIAAGLAWGEKADAIVAYQDFGISPGMHEAFAHYRSLGKDIEWRRLPTELVMSIRETGA